MRSILFVSFYVHQTWIWASARRSNGGIIQVRIVAVAAGRPENVAEVAAKLVCSATLSSLVFAVAGPNSAVYALVTVLG